MTHQQQKSNQLQSHIYNIMIEKRYDLLISQLYEKIPINERNNNKKHFSFNKLLA